MTSFRQDSKLPRSDKRPRYPQFSNLIISQIFHSLFSLWITTSSLVHTHLPFLNSFSSSHVHILNCCVFHQSPSAITGISDIDRQTSSPIPNLHLNICSFRFESHLILLAVLSFILWPFHTSHFVVLCAVKLLNSSHSPIPTCPTSCASYASSARPHLRFW